MLQMQHMVALLLIITSYKINCASIDIVNDIGKALREQIRDEAVIESSHEARSRTKRWIAERIKTPSGAFDSITSLEAPGENCDPNTTLIYLDKHGNMSKKEYALVSSEVEKTKANGCIKILKIRKLKNECLWDRYMNRRENIMIEKNTTDSNERLLFNGTANVWRTVNKGFDERMVGVGTFGAGIYFTDSFAVADSEVTDKTCLTCLRKVLLSRVILGKQRIQMGGRRYAHAPTGLHSVLGKLSGRAYNDYVVYRGDQIYPEYLITYKHCG